LSGDASAWATIHASRECRGAKTTLEIFAGPSDGGDINAVSAAFAGIAETGTLALVSWSRQSTTLHFLPDNHIGRDAARWIEAGLRKRVRKAAPPFMAKALRHARVNFITGPFAIGRYRADLAAGATDPGVCILSSLG